MRNKVLALLIAAPLAFLFYFSCAPGQNPFTDDKTTIYFTVENSKGQNSTGEFTTDTIGNEFTFKITPFLSENIDTIKILLTNDNGTVVDKDTALGKFASFSDTIVYKYAFKTPGIRSAKAIAILTKGGKKEVPAKFNIVTRPIRFASDPANISTIENVSASFSVVVFDSSLTYSYSWRKNGVAIANATKDSFFISSVKQSDTGSYTCVVKNPWLDSATSKPGILKCKALLSGITFSSQPLSLTVNENARAALGVVANNADSTFSYQWYKGAIAVAVPAKDSLIFEFATLSDTGSYTCVVKNKAGDSAITTPAILVVTPSVLTNHSPKISVNGALTILPTQVCSLSVTGTDADVGQVLAFSVTNGPAGSTFVNNVFKWTPAASFIGKDSATFVVMDNGTPVMSDSQKVIITVSKIIPMPDSVTGVTAVSRKNGVFTFKWAKAGNADSYIVYRSTSNTTGFTPRDTVSDTTISDTVKSTGYYYYVKAQNQAGVSAASAKVYSLSINTAPKWQANPINLNGTQGSKLSITLMDKAIDAEGDSVKFTLLTGAPVGDTILGTMYSYTTSATDTNTYYPKIVAKDGLGLADTLTIKLSVIVVDVTKPVVKMITPATDSISTNSASYTVTLECTDASGIASVNGTMGAVNFTGVKGTGNSWTIPVTGLAPNVFNTIVFTVTDSSEKANKETVILHIKNDPAMSDADGPAIKLVSGPASGSTVTNSIVSITDSIVDPSGVDSVYWTLNGVKAGMLVAGSNNKYSLVDTLTSYHLDTIVVYTQDKSPQHNKSSQTIILNYNVLPTWKHKTVNTSVDEAQTYSMSLVDSVNNGDSDPLTFTLLATSKGTIAQNSYSYATTYADSGAYVVKIKVSDGTAADTLTLNLHVVNVNRQPVIAGAADVNAAVGVTVSFTVTATDPDGDAVTLSTSTLPAGATFTANNGKFTWTQAVAGTYNVTFTANDGTGSLAKAIKITISNNPVPTITTDPIAKTLCPGASDSLVAKATGTGTLSYQWQIGGADIAIAANATAKSSTLKLTNVTASNGGSYVCVVSNDGGNVPSKPAVLTINTAVGASIASSATPTICQGNSVTLTCTPTGTGPFKYQWQNTGANITTGGTSATYAAAAAGSYVCVVSGACGDPKTTNAVVVTVNAPAVITVQPTSPGSLCIGATLNLSVTATGTGLSYEWFRGTTSVGKVNPLSITNLGTVNAGDYTCKVTGSCGNPATSTPVTLAIKAAPTISISPATKTITQGETFVFTATAGSVTTLNYKWQKGPTTFSDLPGETKSTFETGSAGTYRCIVTDGCTQSATSNSVVLTVTPTYSLTVNAGTGGTRKEPTSSPITVNKGDQITIDISVNPGYKFVNWTASSSSANISSATSSPTTVSLSGSATVTANFELLSYSITYNAEGGYVEPVPASYNITSNLITLPIPSKNENDFVGWYTNSSKTGNAVVSIPTGTTGPQSFWAKWKLKQYTVTFNPQVSKTAFVQKVNSGGFASTPDPSLDNCKFEGWCEDQAGNLQVDLSTRAITSDLTLWGKWSMTDQQGNYYNVITIGNQILTKENFKATSYTNGKPISTAQTVDEWIAGQGSMICTFNSEILYNWYAASPQTYITIPVGWHIPSKTEWKTLVSTLGGDALAGKKMKEGLFAGILCGWRDSDGSFYHYGENSMFWSSTDNPSPGYKEGFYIDASDYVTWSIANKSNGWSIRLMHD